MSKRALVTAGTSSIGKVIVKTLQAKGYEVVVHYNTNEKLALELSQQVIQEDLSDDDEVEEFVDKAVNLGKYDVVVNNAGITQGQWDEVLSVNVLTPAYVLTRAERLVNPGGVIINVSSVYGHENFGQVGFEAYSASKAAVNNMTKTFAKKLAPGIRVNAVAPGYVESKWNEGRSGEEKKNLARAHLTERLVTAQEVADVVMMLIQNQGINGEIVYVDGGLTLKTI